jgi:hypothetical protein
MPAEIEAFLNAYKMKFICLPCLSAVTGRDDADVRSTGRVLAEERRAETQTSGRVLTGQRRLPRERSAVPVGKTA